MSLSSGQLQNLVVDFFFPRRCIGCGKVGNFLCVGCLQRLPRILPPFCLKCGKPESSGGFCSTCWGWQAEIDGIRSPFRFEGVVRQAIHQLKYQNLRALAAPLAGLLWEYLNAEPIPAEVLVPVPLHQRRQRERGYNQSALLARALGKVSGWPVVEDCLARHKTASPQARTATAAERHCNVADAFSCRDGRLEQNRVLLIDDVATSGATVEACAGALKASGASSVWALVLAREL